MIILFLVPAIMIGLFILFDNLTKGKSEFEKYIEKELEQNPDYIDWLKKAHNGRDYKLGLGIIARIERDRNKVFYRLLKRIRG